MFNISKFEENLLSESNILSIGKKGIKIKEPFDDIRDLLNYIIESNNFKLSDKLNYTLYNKVLDIYKNILNDIYKSSNYYIIKYNELSDNHADIIDVIYEDDEYDDKIKNIIEITTLPKNQYNSGPILKYTRKKYKSNSTEFQLMKSLLDTYNEAYLFITKEIFYNKLKFSESVEDHFENLMNEFDKNYSEEDSFKLNAIILSIINNEDIKKSRETYESKLSYYLKCTENNYRLLID